MTNFVKPGRGIRYKKAIFPIGALSNKMKRVTQEQYFKIMRSSRKMYVPPADLAIK